MDERSLPSRWLEPCVVFARDDQGPVVRGSISRIRDALRAAKTAAHDGGRSDPDANRYGLPEAGGVPPARGLLARCGRKVTHTVTDRGERELSIETGKWDETVRIRFWMPLDRLPVDPDFTDADTCIRNLGNYVRLIEAHLGRISKAVRARGRKADEHSSTRSAIEIQARRIAALATS